jgi:ribosomal protein S27E
MEAERFKLTSSRPRPDYKPLNIKCGSCGAGLTVKDEQSQMVVCEYCGNQLDVSTIEQTVLGKGLANKPHFSLELGDSFHHRATRYEVISRMAFIEDNDISEMTKEYLLYNPRRGSMWLAEYGGHYSISYPSHVMPVKDPFAAGRGDVIKTHDGNQWVMEGKGTYKLHFVDGALPWIAKTGDRVQYAEFAEKAGSAKRYEVQRIGSEIEYGMGRAMPLESVRRATRKPELGKETVSKPIEDTAQKRKGYVQLMVIALVAAIFNGLLAFYCYRSGTLVLNQSFAAADLTNGVMTEPFRVQGNGKITKISVAAPLDNAWMSMAAAIVRSDGKAVHQYEDTIEYYHGRSGGESWSEGSRSGALLVKIPDPGQYRLFVKAVSAHGNASRATRALHDLRVEVRDRALPGGKFALAGGLCLAVFILTAFSFAKWKEDDEE